MSSQSSVRRSIARGIAGLGIAAVVVLGATACTGSPAAGPASSPTSQSADAPGDAGQSTADACALIQESIQDATAEFESVTSADPAAVVDAMSSAAERLSETATEVTNDEVAAVLPGLQAMFAEVADVMDAVAQGDLTQADELSQLATRFQETSDAFQEVCAP